MVSKIGEKEENTKETLLQQAINEKIPSFLILNVSFFLTLQVS